MQRAVVVLVALLGASCGSRGTPTEEPASLASGERAAPVRREDAAARAAQRPGADVGPNRVPLGRGQPHPTEVDLSEMKRRAAENAAAIRARTAGLSAAELAALARVSGGTIRAAESGDLDVAAANLALRGGEPAVTRCYLDALQRDRAVSGKVSLRIVIGDSAAAQSVTTEQDSTHVAELVACVSAAARSWRFPPARGGKPAVIEPTWVFRLTDQPTAPPPR